MDTHKPFSKNKSKRNIINAYFWRMHTLKPGDAFLIKCALFCCVVFASLTVIHVSTEYAEKVAATGGMYTEGIIGTPRFVNPVLAITRADKDLTTLIYDGLMRLGTDGVVVPHIAESVTVSEDGMTYNVILKQTVRFHDDTPLTARDVVFTFNRIQDPLLASPLHGNFDGVRIEEIGEYEINFVLPEAYAPFIENLTFGILPEHIWKDVSSEEFLFSQYNTNPIGSGPYKIEHILHNASGIPESYTLTAFTDYHAGSPKIETLELSFFSTEEKLQSSFTKGLIDGTAGVDTSRVTAYEIQNETHHLERIPLPRTFAVFLNQNKSAALRDISARKALDSAIDREALTTEVLGGYGNPLYSPIPAGFGIDTTRATNTPIGNIDAARDILSTGGWKFNLDTQVWEKEIDKTTTALTFSIATINNSAFEATAEFLRNSWERIGVPVTVKQFEQTDLTQAVIRPRDYEALLFGSQLGRTLDYFSFWHSSQRNDPGLNIALYANITTDSILSEIRRNSDIDAHTTAIQKFAEEIEKETPAIFLFAPELLYILPNHVENAYFKGVGEPHERFMNIHHWYIETDSVWPFFKK